MLFKPQSALLVVVVMTWRREWRFLAGVLYGVEASDPATFTLMAAVLVLAATIASWIPARRAAGVDPVEALRAD